MHKMVMIFMFITALLILLELYFSIVFYIKPNQTALHNKMSLDMAVYNLKLRGKSNDCL